MNNKLLLCLGMGALCAFVTVQAATHTVTTLDNVNPPAGQLSLKGALERVAAGDTIHFNIPGDGPHFVQTPPGGYRLITVNGVTIDGYSQPGSAPNSNGILQGNNAKLRIILDSRNGNVRLLDFPGDAAPDDTGYGDGESCVLGVLGATGATIRGVGILAVPKVGAVSVYGVSFAKGASGRVSGCWIGVGPDGTTVAAPADGVTGFRYRRRDSANTVTEAILVRDVVLGAPAKAADPRADFNVFCGIPAIPVIIEGENLRFSGNYFNVFPDGLHDYNPSFDPALAGNFEGNIEVGRAGNNVLIGTDGDGVNDADERNVFSGVVPPSLQGYAHNIEFYGQTPGTNIVIAGNLIGVAIDRVTAFTNGVPALNAAGGSAQFRFGSDLDGVSDELEGNVVLNNFPADLFPATGFADLLPGNLNFFDELSLGGVVSLRGNTLVNNFPFPVAHTRADGGVDGLWRTNFYAKALADAAAGVQPVLAAATTFERLVGTVPKADKAKYPRTIIDLYSADLSSLQPVIDAGLPGFPNGIVQGRAYAGSFTDNGPEDRDAKEGSFDFNISRAQIGGNLLTITANYERADKVVLTSPFSDVVAVTFTPGGPEEQGLRYLVKDTPIINPELGALGNWEPYISVLGTTTFLIEGNTFAEGSTDSQRYVVALQPAAGGPARLGEGFYADNGTPFKGAINASRQNGNPGRVAGDARPGAVNFIVGGEASPHTLAEFGSDNRWNLGFDRLADGRYGTVQIFSLDPATLAQTPLTKALDAANGRVTAGDPQGNNQITRFGGDVVGLDNGNFVSVVEDRSKLRNPAGNAAVATIFTPAGGVVKESFLVANGDLWANVAPFKGGFAVRVAGVIYFHSNAGDLLRQVDQSTAGASYPRGRGDGERLAGHINSPYVYLVGKVTDAALVKVAAWDSRDARFVALADASEGAFTGGFDRADMAVDALNRLAIAWVSQPEGYGQQQVAARVMVLDGAAKTIKPLTKSFLVFVNAAKTGDLRSVGMNVAMTTKEICIAAKGELNLKNQPALGADSARELNFYAVLSHPAPVNDPTPAVGSAGGTIGLSATRNGDNLTLQWSGGAAPFTVQKRAGLGAATWTDVQTTSDRSLTVPIDGAANFYRVVGQ